MTTIGKILVFLVFVAALGMGGMMLFVARTTPNWKSAVDEHRDAIVALKAMLKQEAESRGKLLRENEKLNKLVESKIQESNEVKRQFDQDKTKAIEQMSVTSEQKNAAVTNAQKAVEENKRLEKEMEFMQNVVNDRQNSIVKLNEELAQARNAEQAAKNDALTAGARMQSLNELLKEKDRLVADLTKKNQPGSGPGVGPRDANYLNPPPVYVKGRVEQVDEDDKSLVKINVGSDSGLRKNQTMEVFRISPKSAEYLGRIVIEDADLHHAIGRLLRQPGMPVARVQAGDQVASTLQH
jgi:myosin heavy subunit